MPYIGTQPNDVKKNTGLYTPSEILQLTKDGSWGGSLELIQSQSVSGVSQVDFTSIQEAKFNLHYVQLISMETASTGHPQASKMQLRFSNDGGSSYESGASAYSWANQFVTVGNSKGESKDNAHSSIEWTPRCNNGEPTSARMYLYDLGNSAKYSFTSSETSINVDQGEFFFGNGVYTTAETINALRFYNDYAMTGTINLFGVKDIS